MASKKKVEATTAKSGAKTPRAAVSAPVPRGAARPSVAPSLRRYGELRLSDSHIKPTRVVRVASP